MNIEVLEILEIDLIYFLDKKIQTLIGRIWK